MSRRLEVVIGPPGGDLSTAPVFVTETKPGDPPGVTGFLKINPAILGWLEILNGASIFGLVFWNYERLFLIPACFVVTSQALNLLNVFSSITVIFVFIIVFYVAFSFRVFLAQPITATEVAFVCINLLAAVFSLIVFATSCCWCRSRKRLMVIHMSAGDHPCTVVPVSPLLADAVDHQCSLDPVVPPISDAVDDPCSVFSPPAYSPAPSSEPPAKNVAQRSRDLLLHDGTKDDGFMNWSRIDNLYKSNTLPSDQSSLHEDFL
ncbi:hypothetical protein DNTS_020256 [Danionella cerebrum]|uniref:Uncharacterized protein n=1 Tax=Danionella cerebrum TaxID=2873325 RepID=A0A553N3J3_9TELE|nr:hypothetical protein DNTS_020256 [Danionella translucida]